MMQALARFLISMYLKSPVKPFRGFLLKCFRKYRYWQRNKTVLAKVDGVRYYLDLNESIDSAIYYFGFWEPQSVAIVRRYLKRGMTVLDIGANIGCYTFIMAKLVGEEGRVIAFEPTSWAFSKLTLNMGLNDFNNVILEKIALSNVSKRNQMVSFRASWTLNDGSANTREEDIVDFISLDDYVKGNNINKVDLVKLDVDGYEYKVIRGAINTLKLHKPLILMELGTDNLEKVGDNISDLLNILTNIGYKFYSVINLNPYPTDDALIRAIPTKGERVINVFCKCD